MKAYSPDVDSRIKITEHKTFGILSYDLDNAYPQRISDLIDASGTGKSCVRLYAKFTSGQGFTDKTFYKAVINHKGGTNDKLLRALTRDYARFGGFAVHVNYNALGEKDGFFHVPFENCRLTIPDDQDYIGKIAVYKDWGRRLKKGNIRKENIDLIHVYNPNKEVVFAQIEAAGGIDNYKGQILYYSENSNSVDLYSTPVVDPVAEDLEADAGIKLYRRKTIDTGFIDQHLLEREPFEGKQEREEFLEMVANHQGVRKSNKFIVVENPGIKEGPSVRITKLESHNSDKNFEVTNRTVKESITQAFIIPPVLVGIQSSGGVTFSNDVVKDAYAFYNSVTSDDRLIFEETFKDLFTGYKENINPSNDYSIIPLTFGV